MISITSISSMHEYINTNKNKGKTVGFVPTMGYLHDGHLSLMQEAREKNDLAFASIYVNPTQFGPNEDFNRYPRDLERDKDLLAKVGIDCLFTPISEEMYPKGYRTYVEVETLSTKLCGHSRPGHFRGVTTIVCKLLNIIKPTSAYFGQKDIQQVTIIKKMVTDLNIGCLIEVMPTVRDKDGLALSSRNIYLNKEERLQAAFIYKALKKAEAMILNEERDCNRIIAEISNIISQCSLARIDYIKICDLENLEHLDLITNHAIITIAVFFGKTRLIDNITVTVIPLQ
ncbi:MAG: pantoate--beta-alanine ligase [bacterium]